MTSDTRLLMYAERFLNENTRTYSKWASYTEAKPDFDPTGDAASFKVIAYKLPESAIHLYEADPTDSVRKLYIEEDGSTWLCVHPQVVSEKTDDIYLQKIQRLALEAKEIEVVPSSSTRTLFVRDSEPFHAVKVHFPFQVSRYGRRMRAEVVQQAIIASQELQSCVEKGAFDERFAFLREVIGIAVKDGEETGRGENWGYLVREMKPYPEAADQRTMMPAFAMYGRDKFNPQNDPVLLGILKKNGQDPKKFVLDNICFPIIRHWVTAFKELGYLLEPHGQNTLIEFNKKGEITRIVHRDLSVGIDMQRRKDMDLSDTHLSPYNQMHDQTFHSVAYDKFMANHHFENLAKFLQTYFSVDPQEMREACKGEFLRVFPEHETYLPRTVHYFSEQRDRYNKPLVVDTKEAPLWRP